MIYLVRHGQTVWNREKRKQGQKDSPLTLTGFKQSQGAAHALKKEITDLDSFNFLCSPLYRAWQFASIICEQLDCLDKLTHINALKEHSFGKWEGLNEHEIEKNFPGMIQQREANWWDYQVPDGESYELLFTRVKKYFETIDAKKNYVIVSHEMVGKMIRKYLLNLSNEESLRLKHPQNIIYKIDNSKLEEIHF